MKPIDVAQLRREVWFEAVASRGPGGQNVNKVASAALLLWDIHASRALTDVEKLRIIPKFRKIINRAGVVFIRSDEFRDLEQNKSRSFEKLVSRLEQARHVPKPRRPTKPTRASKIKRHETKKRRGETKKLRSRVEY